jgi:cytoskeletal protein CcmA (bactofilin family)
LVAKLTKRASTPETNPRVTALDRSSVIKADIRAEEDLYLDGNVEGTLDLGQYRLAIGPNGLVNASIRAREVDISGSVRGNVEATGRIYIRANARLVGDLRMAGVVIEDGAYFKGSIDIAHSRDQAPKPTAVAGSTQPVLGD